MGDILCGFPAERTTILTPEGSTNRTGQRRGQAARLHYTVKERGDLTRR